MFLPLHDTAVAFKIQWIIDSSLWSKGILVQTQINISELLVLFTFAYLPISFSYSVKAMGEKKKFLALASILHVVTEWILCSIHILYKSIWQFTHPFYLIDTISNSPILVCFYIFPSVLGFLDLLLSFVKKWWKS